MFWVRISNAVDSIAWEAAVTRRCLFQLLPLAALVAVGAFGDAVEASEGAATRPYDNRLTPITQADPLLADYPEFVEPIRETARFQAAALVHEPDGDLAIRAWRFSYNARGIIEIPNQIEAPRTAILVVHPWGIDDEHGWRSPEPAGVALCCTPQKNRIYNRHVREVLNPFLKALRPHVALVGYSLPGVADPIRKRLYRSVHGLPTEADRQAAARELTAALTSFDYRANPVTGELLLSATQPVRDYFRQFPGLDAGVRFNGQGFWQLPIPVASGIDVATDDVVFYDAEGYPALRDFLQNQGIRHVLLCGYNTDMCVCSTTAGYENVSRDFNLFLVGDATLATFPACETPRFATQTALAKAALGQMITQISWIKPRGRLARGERTP
jgi:nicotinamidase-related amidase